MIIEHATRESALPRDGSRFLASDALAIAITCGFRFLSFSCASSAKENRDGKLQSYHPGW
jgi:hypothetical protein